jgi:hypothetical protein
MPRARSLKPAFFTNEDLGECSPLARLFFAGLWCWADREGYVEDRPRRLRAQILPYDEASGESLVLELLDRGLVERLTVKGERVLYLPTFAKHQDPHPRETPSRYAQGGPKADLGGVEQVTSPSSPSCPSQPSCTASQPIPINVGMAVVPDWLAGVQEALSQALNTPVGVGKDPGVVVEAFTRRRAYLAASGYDDPDSTLVGDCLGAASRSKPDAGKPSSLAFFVGWLNRATPKNFATGGNA